MARLRPVSFKDLVGGLRSQGFDGPFGGGKHLFMVKGNLRITLPNPHRQQIGIDLLKRILRQAGISLQEWAKRSE